MNTLLLGIGIGLLGVWLALKLGWRIPEDWSPRESFPPMECGHNGYWRTHYGNCMACRAERAEAQARAALIGLGRVDAVAEIEREWEESQRSHGARKMAKAAVMPARAAGATGGA